MIAGLLGMRAFTCHLGVFNGRLLIPLKLFSYCDASCWEPLRDISILAASDSFSEAT